MHTTSLFDMSKHLIIGLAAAVVVAGGGYYFYTAGSSDSMMSESEPTSLSGSMKDLLARTNSQCTVSNKTENSESTGTVYVGNGKMRGDFKTVTSQPVAMTIESHMISDGTTVYTWSDQAPQGFKMAVNESGNAETQPSAPEQDQVGMYNAKVAYDCSTWKVEEEKFTVPSTIQFMDVAALTKGMAPMPAPTNGAGNPPSKSQQCNMCDQAPEPQRSQCRQALNCR